jgi:CheY-like chemotaxis protein
MVVRPSILVVDDDPAVLLTYTMILRQHGYEVTGAASARAAMENLSQQQQCDLLVCDLALESSRGGLDVVDFARQLIPGIPAILLTGFASGEASEEARQKDVVVLFKPLDVRDLLDAVARLLSPNQRLRAENE